MGIQYRMVGVISTPDTEVIASNDQISHECYGLRLHAVGPPNNYPKGLMIYYSDQCYLPSCQKAVFWELFKKRLDEALSLPVLHREDFTLIFEH